MTRKSGVIFGVIFGVVVCMILFASSVEAARKEVNLNAGESIVFKGRNITLMAANVDSFLLCMNGKKFVVEDDRNFQGVVFDVRQKSFEHARFEVVVPENGGGGGEDCEECGNQGCYVATRAGCFADAECVDEDACTLDSCVEGKCQSESNASCGGVTSTTLPAGDLAASLPPYIPGGRGGAGGEVGNAVTGNAVTAPGNEAYRAATLILGVFLLVLVVIASFVVKKKAPLVGKEKQKYS